ncbi:hypothetical protein OIV83_001332 [Microbotryomycetes sp. JL201]|nr:hypothetical protein OIV83_001332 [Microbotryomycetes sp. JL201]
MEPPAFPLPDSQQRASSARPSQAPTFSVHEPEDDQAELSDDEAGPLPPFTIEGGMLPPPASTTKLSVARGGSANAPSSTKPKRSKVFVQPGFSQLDWAQLQRSGQDLRASCAFFGAGKLSNALTRRESQGGVTQLMRITPAMLAQHKSKDDCWQAYGGKVYNVTRFLPYHPGGIPQMMRVAGKDVKTHAWVNVDLMLEKCLIGFLVSG